MSPGKTVIVLMSGGVDSSVAALILGQQGYEVLGVTMRIWGGGESGEETGRHACYGPGEDKDIDDARRVATALDFPLHVFDLQEDYDSSVLGYLRAEYLQGHTPNPCIRCNRMVKLGSLPDRARQSGLAFDYVATGHYARVSYDRDRGRHLLMKAKDRQKDQSYFLHSLSQEQLRACLFPVGGYAKSEVRAMAAEAGLVVSRKAESQDFIAGGRSPLFREAAQPGPILDRNGKAIGRHRGIPFYTVGQRRGLGVGSGEALYVTEIDAERNALVVGPRESLYRKECTAIRLNWVSVERLDGEVTVRARIRYRHREAEARIAPIAGDRVRVHFREPQMAISPGQAIVFYEGDAVMGGGTIEGRPGPEAGS